MGEHKMKYVFAALIAVVALMFLAAPATADWQPGDPYKMHFPQLPDPNGWDVNFESPKVLADDWECIESGRVRDIHFWFSAENNELPTVPLKVRATIYENRLAGEDDLDYSHPGKLLWGPIIFTPTIRLAGTGQQGFFDPNYPERTYPPHFQFWQANIEQIERAFVQTAGNIYWLGLTVVQPVGDPENPMLGWKTTLETMGFMDDAVFGHLPAAGVGEPTDWREVWINDVSRHLAFVITPEPGTVVMLLGAGLIGLLGYARNRRKR
jgi:hypothetical protein